jgi:hypothetical protein
MVLERERRTVEREANGAGDWAEDIQASARLFAGIAGARVRRSKCARSRRRSDDKGGSRRGERVGAGEGGCSDSAVQGKKEIRAGADGGARFCGHGRGLKPICGPSTMPSGPGTRPRMCGWTRQGRAIKWCQAGPGAAPFQRSWRRAATSSTGGAGSQGADMDGRVACRRERARRASAERPHRATKRPTGCSRRCSAAKPTTASAGRRHVAHTCEGTPLAVTHVRHLSSPPPTWPCTSLNHRCQGGLATDTNARRIASGRCSGATPSSLAGWLAGCSGGIDDVPICHVSASSERHQPTRKLSSTVLALTRRLRLLSPAPRQGLPALILYGPTLSIFAAADCVWLLAPSPRRLYHMEQTLSVCMKHALPAMHATTGPTTQPSINMQQYARACSTWQSRRRFRRLPR